MTCERKDGPRIWIVERTDASGCLSQYIYVSDVVHPHGRPVAVGIGDPQDVQRAIDGVAMTLRSKS